jgi:GLPGLI family protein
VRFIYILFIAVIFAITVCSCKKKGGKYINQGEIHYNIDYRGSFGSMPREVLPKNLVVSFKNNKILFEMISSFGNSGILNLANPEKGILDTYFSLFTLKYFYAVQPGEQFPGFEAMEGIVITKTAKKSVICGFNCKNAEVTFPSDRNKVYEVWYTNEINIKNPNTATPYSQIDGVLMSFFFFLGASELHFDAETVYKKEIPDEAFDRREKFERVSRDEIDKFINKMISL